MSNWDDEDFEPPVAGSGAALPVAGDAWEGEDEDVKDDWDADSDEEKKKAEDANAEQAGGVKKKKTLQDKIREREERQREIMEKKAEAERIYTEAEKRQMQEESDLLIAQDALGVENLSLATNQGLLEKFDPKGLEDFVEFRFQLTNKLLSYKDSPHYYLFTEDLFRELASGLSSEDTRKLSTMLLAMSNEKVKREKEGKKGKNKSKKQLKQVGNAISEYGNGYGDDDQYDDAVADEFDDFL
ncbi:eukaryotic translation initiation factor 3 subunit J-A-like [Convolutriloba macropyga]|uniref:eukaryotic translation initiation factor 3 subunit J-A-like n=1 Tax=Convolutriloba macropyga TaxID=536237 RepID=UPI003F52571F